MGSPTLAELNASMQLHVSKRPLLSTMSTSLSPSHSSYMNVVGDSSNVNIPSPQMAFGDREAGFEDLSSSFRSLYKSLFGSVGSSISPHGSSEQDYNGLLPPTGLSSNSTSYSALGTSLSRTIINMADVTQHTPPFTSLMDNLKDIAEKNRWETLNPLQIQSLRESFKSGNHNNFGMEQDAFLEWSHSFDQFLSQLDSRIPINAQSSGSLPHTSYHLSDHLAPPPPPYSQHTSASNSYGNSRMDPPFVVPSSLRDSSNNGSHLQLQKTPPLFRSAATDLLEDDDEFDWSKLV